MLGPLMQVNDFGLATSIAKFIGNRVSPTSDIGSAALRFKHKQIIKYLTDSLDLNVALYNYYDAMTIKDSAIPNKVWVCWWTGEHTLPDICRLCLKSMRRAFGEENVTLISEQNFRDFTSLSDAVVEKFNNGKITIQTFSDLLRANLLYTFGGYWLDATVFVTQKPKLDSRQNFFSIKRAGSSHFVSNLQWTAFALGSCKNGVLFGFLDDMFERYYERNDKLVDYFLIDYLIRMAFDNIPQVTRSMLCCPVNSQDCYSLYGLLDKPFDEQQYTDLATSDSLHKLNWKYQPSLVKNSVYWYLNQQ